MKQFVIFMFGAFVFGCSVLYLKWQGDSKFHDAEVKCYKYNYCDVDTELKFTDNLCLCVHPSMKK